jgi:hypothetical protein
VSFAKILRDRVNARLEAQDALEQKVYELVVKAAP